MQKLNKVENELLINHYLKTTKREGIEKLLEWMKKNGFFESPCSSKYHLAKPGGLAEHSLNVLNAANTMFHNLPGIQYSEDLYNSIVICSLLHDLGKAGQFGKATYIENPDPEGATFKTNKDLLYVPHEVRSIAIASRFIELTEEEQFAILYHNGLYSELTSVKNNETPLQMIIHYADLWACRVMEKEEA